MLSVPLSRRTLIVAPATVTDAVLSQPLVAALRGRDPLGLVDVLAPAPLAAVYRAMSGVRTVIETSLSADRLAPIERARLASRLAATGYHRAFVLEEAVTSALVPWLARIPERLGAGSSRRLGLITRPLPSGQPLRSRADRYASLAFAADQPLPPGLLPPLLDRCPPLPEQTARQLGLDPTAPLILIAPTSELGPTREWPVRHYAELLNQIHRRWPAATIGLLGQARDRAITTRIALLAGNAARNWAGLLDTAGTMALLGRAAVVVTGESETMHLAAALGRPHVAIYGAGDPRAERIAASRRSVLWLRLACNPCEASHCPLGHLKCLNGQTPEAVFTAVSKSLRFSATT